MSMEIGGQPVPLPPGWGVEVGRESSAVVNGQTLSGLTFNLNYPLQNITTSVFVPYSVMNNVAAVSQLFAQRIQAVQGVQGLASGGVS